MSAKMTRSKPYMRAGEPETEEPMKTRYVLISPHFLATLWSTRYAWNLGQNKLPEDIEVDRVEMADDGIRLWVTSSVFQETDPDELSAPNFIRYHVNTGLRA